MFAKFPFTRVMCLAAAIVVVAACGAPVDAQVATPVWPMYGQNAQRTGESLYPGPLAPTVQLSLTYGTAEFPVIGATAVFFRGQYGTGAWDYGIVAVNFDDTTKWKFSFPAAPPAIGPDGTLYFGDPSNGGFYALDPEGPVNADGTLDDLAIKWSIPATTIGLVQNPPLIDKDGNIFVSGRKIEGATGQIIWGPIQAGGGNPAMALDDKGDDDTSNDVLYANGGLNLCAINAKDGTTRWTRTFKYTMNEPAVGDDGTVYLATSSDFTLWAINPRTGATKWQAVMGKKAPGLAGATCHATPAVDNFRQRVYCAGLSSFYCFDFTGKQKWVKSTPVNNSTSSPSKPAIGSDGIVYWCDRDGKTLYAMSPVDGHILWSALGHASQHPVIGPDGTLYVGSGPVGNNGLMAYSDD